MPQSLLLGMQTVLKAGVGVQDNVSVQRRDWKITVNMGGAHCVSAPQLLAAVIDGGLRIVQKENQMSCLSTLGFLPTSALLLVI